MHGLILAATPTALGARLSARPAPRNARRTTASGRSMMVARAASIPEGESLQLGTAALPAGLNEEAFNNIMFQWATSLTTSGQNMPFALPQRVDRLDNGW